MPSHVTISGQVGRSREHDFVISEGVKSRTVLDHNPRWEWTTWLEIESWEGWKLGNDFCLKQRCSEHWFNYPPEVSTMKYCWEYLGRNTSGSLLTSANRGNTLKYWYRTLGSKNKKNGQNTPLCHHTDSSPMGLGQYNSVESIVALILPPPCFLYY